MVLKLLLSLCTVVLVAAEPVLFEPDPFAGMRQQLRGPAEDLDPVGDTVEEDGRSEKWLRDISTRTKNHFKKLLQPLQTPIVQEYQVLTILDGYVNYTMQLVANATGHEVVWNRTGRWLSEEPRALRPRKQELPPRARYINKILLYLNKEMEVVWNLVRVKVLPTRLVEGVEECGPVGDALAAAGGSMAQLHALWTGSGGVSEMLSPPRPMARMVNTQSAGEQMDKRINLVFHIKPDVEEHENKYAKQLQADYESLVRNINDASQKISDLRTRLWKMEDFAKQFIALPSGVWNKIDANCKVPCHLARFCAFWCPQEARPIEALMLRDAHVLECLSQCQALSCPAETSSRIIPAAEQAGSASSPASDPVSIVVTSVVALVEQQRLVGVQGLRPALLFARQNVTSKGPQQRRQWPYIFKTHTVAAATSSCSMH
ncbi:unnamed protein product [Symbiodinium sp. CCMP2592]|nr:unnamed protein product [Symbiodinium sp. CCMP2592]